MPPHEPPSAPPPDTLIHGLAFLASAGELLGSSLDLDQTLQNLARLAVPALGDLCIVDLVEDGGLRRVAVAHVSPAKTVLLETLRRDYPPTPDSPQPAARVLRTGEPELLETVTPEIRSAHVRDEEHDRLIRELGIRSHLAVPLVARQTTVGILCVGITESDRRYGHADLDLVQDLARRAALAVDNARLYMLAQVELAARRRVEDALRLSEAHFRAIVEQSPLSIQVLAPSGQILRTNRAWEELWGVTADQIAGYNILEDPQLDARGITPLLRRAFQGEPVQLPTIRYDPNETIPDISRRPDPVRWAHAYAYPVKDAAGLVREVVLVHEDVTETRKAQERLRSSEQRLRLALDAGRMTVWDWDLVTDLVECSDNAREFWGIDVGPVSDFLSAIHPDDVVRVTDATQRAIAETEPYAAEYRVVAPDGRIRWVHSRGRLERDASGRAIRLLGVTLDLSELKAAEENTRLLAEAGGTLGASLDYHATLENLSRLLVPRLADWCAVDLVTESGGLERVTVNHRDASRVALANELFARYPPRRADPHGVFHVLTTGEAEWVPEIDDGLLETFAYDAEHLALIRGLGIRSFICVPLVARGAPIGVLTLAYAESGRRYRASDLDLAMDLARRAGSAVENSQLYQQLRADDRRKDEFLATLAHELRNPLAPIATGLALLRTTTDAAVAERTRQIMERQLRHMVRLIDDLLDLSRVTRGRVTLARESVELAAIVATAVEATRPMIDNAGVQLFVRLPATPIMLDADRTRIAQVLSNLLNNAAKFTPAGGRVELEAEQSGPDIVIRVRDSGAGIPPEMLAHIFEMFAQVGDRQTRTDGGLGIGLTLVKRLVELHGGRVHAESLGPGHGSEFIVRLPSAGAGTSAESPPGPADAPARPSPRRVLVVDDNADAAEMLAALLTFDGHDVRTALDGPAALAAVRDFSPDIAFLDIGLPGMSGFELARRLREVPDLADATLVAVTGWGQDEDRRESRNAGLDHHLTKPVNPEEVRRLVAECARRAN